MTDTSAPRGGATSSTPRTRSAMGSTAYRSGSATSNAPSPITAAAGEPGTQAGPTQAGTARRSATAGAHRPGYEPAVLSPGPAAAPAPPARRRARLVLMKIDPWSAMKVAFTLSIAVAIVILVAVSVLWFVLDAAGVFAAIDRTVSDVAPESSSWTVDEIVAFPRVMGFSMLLAVIEVVLVTALATLAAFMYNLCVGLVGGLEVTLAEDA
ncbi:MAG: DUF3566 domain-containing protein [Candidatus Nanopelagicales bacterium]